MTARAGGPEAGRETVEDVRALLDAAIEAYRDEPAVAARLRAERTRLDEPPRIALVGRVGSGKSTLLNAVIGARLAPTGARECTRVATLYRHGATPRVVLHRTDGSQHALPVRRARGGLRLDLAGTPAEDVHHVAVEWPAADLASAAVVETPGISSLTADPSARTRGFLAAGEGMPGADAVVFLIRQPQPEDAAVLSAFQAAAGAPAAHRPTIVVLSRADEVGSGRIDALHAAEAVARGMSADPAIRAVSSAVVPVAGQLALAGRTLRHGDLLALRSLAVAEPAAVSGMLLTADRFCWPEAPVPLLREVRTSLLDRLGLFGIRTSVALVRAGVADASALAEELLRRSGLTELQRLLRIHVTARSAQLKAGAALRVAEEALGRVPVAGADALRAEAERIRLTATDLGELAILARYRSAGELLPADLRAEAERLLGAEGTAPAARLGLPGGAPREQLRTVARAALRRWRDAATDPLADRPTADTAEAVARSCEGVLAVLDGWSATGDAEPGPGPQRQERG